jgi:hypothetical protein
MEESKGVRWLVFTGEDEEHGHGHGHGHGNYETKITVDFDADAEDSDSSSSARSTVVLSPRSANLEEDEIPANEIMSPVTIDNDAYMYMQRRWINRITLRDAQIIFLMRSVQ